jgi:hypothetical protein
MTINFEKLPNIGGMKGLKEFSAVNIGDEIHVDFNKFTVDDYGLFAMNKLYMAARANKLKCGVKSELTGQRMVLKFLADYFEPKE